MAAKSLFLATLVLHFLSSSLAIRIIPTEYVEAPKYINGLQCENPKTETSYIHVAMTLDSKYLRGTIASVHSILKHADCPENIHFHFISAAAVPRLSRAVYSAFPNLPFTIYPLKRQISNKIKKLISGSIRPALEDPLNYARIYLSNILDPSITRVVYLDSDTIVVEEIKKLWLVNLTGSRVIGAPEYCQVDLKKYFNGGFWADPVLAGVFQGKRACYFNTGVMVMDLERWRRGDYTSKIEGWMEVQKERRIYELGSLPPFMLVFGGEIEGVHHRWNQHGLGGDNVVDSCRGLHPGRVSLLHWSGKGKPWVRLDEGRPCPVDHLWAPYDLHTVLKERW